MVRTAIIQAILKAISVFLILYFLTVGFQVLGWLHSDPLEGINVPIGCEYIGPETEEQFQADQLAVARELGLLRFTPTLWPLAGHWYIYR